VLQELLGKRGIKDRREVAGKGGGDNAFLWEILRKEEASGGSKEPFGLQKKKTNVSKKEKLA